MKKKLSYLFAAVAFMTSMAVAQEAAKPYIIKNSVAKIISIRTAKGTQLPDLPLGGQQNLSKEDFPLKIFSGDPDFTTPGSGLVIPQENSYEIQAINKDPRVSTYGQPQPPLELGYWPMAVRR